MFLRLCKSLRILLPVVMIIVLPQAAAAYGTYNLADEWSNISNPNGRWTYYGGANPMAAQPNNEWGQKVWATNSGGIPQWFKCTVDNPNGYDIEIDDTGLQSSNSAFTWVAWTVDSTGFATISGGVWSIRDTNVVNRWGLSLNTLFNPLLTGGQYSYADGYERDDPFLFSAGSKGAAAVTNIPVTAGDLIILSIDSLTTGLGDYAGVDLTITTSAVPVPVPPSAWLMGSGLLGLWAWRRRNRRI